MKHLLLTVPAMAFVLTACFEIQPHNTLKDCRAQCEGSKKSKACHAFCDSIHVSGLPLNKCLDEYDAAPADSAALAK
jgi:hypothetical protein